MVNPIITNKMHVFFINLSEIDRVQDHADDAGDIEMTCVLDSLKADTEYNVTVIARNIHGDSNDTSEFLTFTTFGKHWILDISYI